MRQSLCRAAVRPSLVAIAVLGAGCSAASTKTGDAGTLDAAGLRGEGSGSDARSDITPTSSGCSSSAPVEGDQAETGVDGQDTSLPSCGGWLSASASQAAIESTLQLSAAGRDAGFGSVLDWDVTGGYGSGQFTNVTATSATFTCLTPGPVVVTATDPSGQACGGSDYDQASVTIQCGPSITPVDAAATQAPNCGPARGGESSWCQQQQGAHTLCEDFDQGFPGKLSIGNSAGPTVREDDADYQSAPRSLLATTSPISPLDVESTTWGSFISPVAGASFHLQADFKVGSDCFSNVSRPVTLARVDYPDVSYELAYSVTPALSGSGLGFVLQVGESEATPQTAGPFGPGPSGSSFLPTDQWARLTLWAQLAAGSGTGGFSVTPLAANAPTDATGGGLSGPRQTPTSAPMLRIGVDAAAHGCSVHIDNVLLDVK